MEERLHHSYGVPFQFPNFPQASSGAYLAPGASGLGHNRPQQQIPFPANAMISRVGSSAAAAFFATEAYMGLSRYDLEESTTTFNNLHQHQHQHQLAQASQNVGASQFPNMNQFGREQPASGNNMGSPSIISSSKTRIRWTQDLHDRFLDCVNRLGGPEKARPKGILQLMDTEGLTIFHVKSHLQKYRNVKYVPESVEGRSNKRTNTTNVAQIDMETGMQIKEALQLQLDVQMHLHEQLEIQRNLQVSIEEQGKKLKMMLDQQQKTNSTVEQEQDVSASEGSDVTMLSLSRQTS